MKMLINGKWKGGKKTAEVRSPYSGEVIDTVPVADAADVESALSAAEQGAKQMAAMPACERAAILRRAADLCEERAEELAQTMVAEVGKPVLEARAEAGRAAEILRLAAFEGAHLRGETLPLDALAIPPAEDKFGMTVPIPCGVVVAITPFNFPVLLVLHKIAPALAVGNAVILKPASATPLSALKLAAIMMEAGLPPGGLQCLCGGGGVVGAALCKDSRVRKISFTGSFAVGEQIAKDAGVKKLSLELGANSPCVVLADADIKAAVQSGAVGGYANAGQVCISMQRVLADEKIYDDYVSGIAEHAKAIRCGDPADENTKLAAMISENEAARVDSWVGEAVNDGARLITGGKRDGAKFAATVLADVKPQMRVFCDEVFGPAIGITKIKGLSGALELLAKDSYGLSASVFTNDIGNALHFARAARCGNVHINWTPMWRNDMMPYGGVGKSGIGKEGVRSTVREMCEDKTIVFHNAKK
ncbi:MAG: aldehyde dehydrogenase family protein [Gammaproteobacteria bacterium]